MDLVSKEIFFQENILFLEGQEDVGLLQKYFHDQDINIFGYGVRGYDQFEFALKLTSDLGIKKACIIIDSAKNPNVLPNENKITENLQNEYGKKYKIIQWRKTDIRDKPDPCDKNRLSKEGYFTIDGNLKEEKDREDFDEKIEEIKKYFQN